MSSSNLAEVAGDSGGEKVVHATSPVAATASPTAVATGSVSSPTERLTGGGGAATPAAASAAANAADRWPTDASAYKLEDSIGVGATATVYTVSTFLD